ncbi:MAG: bifunctional 4-hydroxy-2-oxoglutarate aldolase/2-dehydro-3-deoxy-phosphogluconate aldolase [Rhodobacteraceae bacterium]|nr:bifunctional 4-hydroxy-2-oxoglutarate aldolase/2-dehydro-3-deoxy-phosphogluconate aldolase [Paracoccaceae bacterium]
MRSRSEILHQLIEPGVIAVVRTSQCEQVLPITGALLAGGVSAIEVTMTTPNAIEMIRETRAAYGDRALIGVGTVLDVGVCRRALEAGAEFVVSPILRPELVPVCHAADKPVMLGAFTPTEAQLAHEAGADFIKVFPSDTLGAGFIRAVRAPLPHLRIIPTGIADARQVPELIRAGCVAVGVGSLLVGPEVLRDSNWPELTRRAAMFVESVRMAR